MTDICRGCGKTEEEISKETITHPLTGKAELNKLHPPQKLALVYADGSLNSEGGFERSCQGCNYRAFERLRGRLV